ncbi:MAG: hypothetical protein QOK00_1096 [Thermoleophilaceae bacterium]|nr:hypothetical protein [Thermoleophilaceae bacterium]MEA2400693.1 hypothetical protein [Thermoleophilaceae bacterium]
MEPNDGSLSNRVCPAAPRKEPVIVVLQDLSRVQRNPVPVRPGSGSEGTTAGVAAAAPVYPWVVTVSRWQPDAAHVVELVRRATEREEPFALIIVLDPAVEDGEVRSVALEWIRQNRRSVGVWCRGVAYVVPGPMAPRTARGRFGGSPFVWGCRVAVTQTLQEALNCLDAASAAPAPAKH